MPKYVQVGQPREELSLGLLPLSLSCYFFKRNRILLKTPGEHPSVTFKFHRTLLLEGLIPLHRGNQPEMGSLGLSL